MGNIIERPIRVKLIANADVEAAAAIAYSKLNLATSILNADVSASAAIVDTKLATISTAGKVSDSALSSNVALENVANSFTLNQTIIKTLPILILDDSSGNNQSVISFRKSTGTQVKQLRTNSTTSELEVVNAANTTVIMSWNDTGSQTIGIVPLARIEGYDGSVVWDAGSIVVGSTVSTTFTVTGAALGDFVIASPSTGLEGAGYIILTAYVSAADVVRISLHNIGAATTDPASRTYYVKVITRV